MARVWREVASGKVHAEDDSVDYMCGMGVDTELDKKLPKKPKGNVCKNCMRVINKKK